MSNAPIIINNVVNAKGTPQILADILPNRPAPTVVGRLFVDLTNLTLQRSNGTIWQTIGGGTPPVTPDLQEVTNVGNTTTLEVNALGFKGGYITDGVAGVNFANNNLDISTNDSGAISLFNQSGNTIFVGSLGIGIDIISNSSVILINGENGVNINSPGGTVNLGTNTIVNGGVAAQNFVVENGTNQQILAGDGSLITAGSGITISGGQIFASGVSVGTLQQVTTAGNTTDNQLILLPQTSNVSSLGFGLAASRGVINVGPDYFDIASNSRIAVLSQSNVILNSVGNNVNLSLGDFGQNNRFRLESNNRGEIQTVNELQLISDLSISLQASLVAIPTSNFQVNAGNNIELQSVGGIQIVSTSNSSNISIDAAQNVIIVGNGFLSASGGSFDFDFSNSAAISRIAHTNSIINIEALEVQTIGDKFTINTQSATGNLPVSFLGTTEIGGIVYLVLESNGITYNLQLA